MADSIIPQNYEQWRHCITEVCQQPLTSRYIDERIKSLTNPKDHMTQQFVQLYGEPQRVKTMQWFERAQKDLTRP